VWFVVESLEKIVLRRLPIKAEIKVSNLSANHFGKTIKTQTEQGGSKYNREYQHF
jgi:hypothetical protein